VESGEIAERSEVRTNEFRLRNKYASWTTGEKPEVFGAFLQTERGRALKTSKKQETVHKFVVANAWKSVSFGR
jgi:hypothetical protein